MNVFGRKKFCLKLPKYHFHYYRPDKNYVDLEKLIAGVKILSQNQIEINTNLQSLSVVEFKDGRGSLGGYYLEDMDQAKLGIILKKDMTLDMLVFKINQVIETKKYDIPTLSVEVIFQKSKSESIIDGIQVISDIMIEHGYCLIQALEVCDDFISIVSVDEKTKLDILEAK